MTVPWPSRTNWPAWDAPAQTKTPDGDVADHLTADLIVGLIERVERFDEQLKDANNRTEKLRQRVAHGAIVSWALVGLWVGWIAVGWWYRVL